MARAPAILEVSRTILRGLVRLNLAFAALVLAICAALFATPATVLGILGSPDASATVVTGLRLLTFVGLASVPLSHLILTRLVLIVDTVRDGDPFVAENASRLDRMAWALLGLEALHLVSIAISIGASDGKHHLEWSLSFTGWLAVLLLFVLARVFSRGALMREDLEGTI